MHLEVSLSLMIVCMYVEMLQMSLLKKKKANTRCKAEISTSEALIYYLVFTEAFVHGSEHFILQTWQKLFLSTAFSDILIGKERRPKFPL